MCVYVCVCVVTQWCVCGEGGGRGGGKCAHRSSGELLSECELYVSTERQQGVHSLGLTSELCPVLWAPPPIIYIYTAISSSPSSSSSSLSSSSSPSSLCPAKQIELSHSETVTQKAVVHTYTKDQRNCMILFYHINAEK